VGTNAEMNFRQKTSVFDRNNNVIRWNAFTSYKFLKEKNLELRARVNDILDQNIGFERNVNSNYIEEKTYNTLRRYFLFSIIWNFHKKGVPAPTNEF
jgi:hypothetical protein